MADANKTLATKQYVDDVAGSAITVDQTYNPESANAQSGIAVAQAVDTCSPAIVTASDTGKALSIPDSSESALKGLTAYGESVQDGTPTPDSPVEIVSVENPKISVYGKNLFDKDTMIISGAYVSGTGQYQTSASSEKTAIIPVPKNSTVTFSKIVTSILRVGLCTVYPTSGTQLVSFQDVSNKMSFTAATGNNSYLVAFFYNNSGETGNYEEVINSIQLEIGSTVTNYEPYTAQTVTIPYTFRGLKNSSGDWVARDELRVRGGKVEIIRNVGTYTFNGTETWSLYSSETPSCIWTPHLQDKTVFAPNQYCLSSKLQGQVSAGGGAYTDNAIWFQNTEQFKRTYIALQNKWTDLITAKQWLASNNINIQYVNAVVEIEDITATETGQALLALKTNYPTTSVISDIDLNLTYKLDTQEYIDNKIDQTYNPESANAQSGVAVEQAIKPTTMYFDEIKFSVSANILNESMVGSAAGWSNSGLDLTHTSGTTNPLQLNFGSLAVKNEEWLISFNATGVTSDYLYISFGNNPLTKVYNGGEEFNIVIPVSENNDSLIFTPTTEFNGTITNLQARKIVDEGGTEISLSSLTVSTGGTKKIKSGFWNVIIGTDNTLANSPNATRTIAMGYAALSKLISGNRNIAIGTHSMREMLGGEDNVSIGADNMIYNKSAEGCISIGKGAMSNGDNVRNCIAIGAYAMANVDPESTRKPSANICVGDRAGLVAEGSNNIFVGAGSGAKCKRDGNIAIGAGAYSTAEYGNNNIVIGNVAMRNSVNYNGCVVIGDGAQPDKAKQTVIGNSGTVETKVYGDFVVQGTDGIKRKIVFNEDGTCSWSTL